MLERITDAFNERNVDALVELVHPDAEFVPTGLITPAGASYHGPEGMRSANEQIVDGHNGVRVEFGAPEQLGRWILTEVKFTGTNDPAVDGVPSTVLIEFDDGRMRRAKAFETEEEARTAAYAAGAPILTNREREIFRMLALGFNAPEIAEQLFLSPATVRTHVQNGVSRLGARTRVQAVALALTRGEIAI